MQNDTAYWVALNHVPGIGPVTFHNLIEKFGSAKQAWLASEADLAGAGIGEKVRQAIVASQATDPAIAIRSIQQKKIDIITRLSAHYPRLLAEIYDPPPVLYSCGSFIPADNKAIAVVGTRKMTGYGAQVTTQLVKELVYQGFTIVSGLARGVDACAHKAALEAGGRTIAVLGGGLNHLYPPEHRQLARQIIKGRGAVISEFPPDLPALPGNFPARNRIISGLSLGVMITEAAERSGTMITVATALEQNREVFAVPGPITSALSVGTMRLIKEGAKLVTCVEDILEELRVDRLDKQVEQAAVAEKLLSAEEQLLLTLLENETQDTDSLVRQSGLSSSQVMATLSILELSGLICAPEPSVWAKR